MKQEQLDAMMEFALDHVETVEYHDFEQNLFDNCRDFLTYEWADHTSELDADLTPEQVWDDLVGFLEKELNMGIGARSYLTAYETGFYFDELEFLREHYSLACEHFDANTTIGDVGSLSEAIVLACETTLEHFAEQDYQEWLANLQGVEFHEEIASRL